MGQEEEHVKRILKVMAFIEENIDEDLNLVELAKVACYSPFHFHRVFQEVSGETIHSYAKRLRIERAASKLRYGKQAITMIALDANFETPSAFTKAFKQFTGSSPRNYRLLHAAVNEMTKKLKDLPMIKPVAIEKSLPPFRLLFVRRCGNYTQTPSEAWETMMKFISENCLADSKIRYFGISHDNPEITSEDKLRYDAAILVSIDVKGKGEVGCRNLEGGKYAIFTHQGPL